MLYFLLDQLLALFDETNFEPLFENLVGLLLLNLLLEPFFLFFSELLFPLQCFLHELLFLPLVHATGALLIFLVLLGLLLHQLLIQVTLGLMNQYVSQVLLMLLAANPFLM
jgi:hypothetical protein